MQDNGVLVIEGTNPLENWWLSQSHFISITGGVSQRGETRTKFIGISVKPPIQVEEPEKVEELPDDFKDLKASSLTPCPKCNSKRTPMRECYGEHGRWVCVDCGTVLAADLTTATRNR